jgi:hypothetical protein
MREDFIKEGFCLEDFSKWNRIGTKPEGSRRLQSE